MSLTKKVISRVVELGLERYLLHWKANPMIYKVMSHVNFLILKITRSKEPPFASRWNGDFPVRTVGSPIRMVVRSSACIVRSSALKRHARMLKRPVQMDHSPDTFQLLF
jgi:hypothetical protein